MSGIFTSQHFFLLQASFFREDNPMDAVIIFAVLGGIILIAVVIRLIRGGGPSSGSSFGSAKSSGGKGGSSAVSPRKFNSFSLYRISSAYGLDRDQAKLLEYVFRNEGVTDPEKVMKTPAMLDRHFRKAYKTIQRSSNNDDEAQQRLVKLFSLRNVIEAAPGQGGASPASSQLAENTPAVLSTGKENFPVRVQSSHGQNIVIDMPRNSLGSPIRLTKGTKVNLSFFTKSSKGFSYEGQVVGSVDTPKGPGLQVTHSGKMKSLVKRMYRRRQTSSRCEFFMVFIEDSGGRKKAPKLIVDSKRFSGTVQDVSIGGCSIKTSAPIQIGSRLKITLECSEGVMISVLGHVLRVNRSGPMGTIIHIKFLKVPRKAFNSISALVFGYNEE